MEAKKRNSKRKKIILKKCHICSHLTESFVEISKCESCNKSFLPSNYFSKVHCQKEKKDYYDDADDLKSESLIKGLDTLW